MEKSRINYLNTMSALTGVELHGCISGVFAYDQKGYGLKDRQPVLFKSLLRELLNGESMNARQRAIHMANWLNQAKAWVGQANERKFEFWISRTSIFEDILFEKQLKEDAFTAYLGLKDTPVTSSLASLTREQIEARGLTREECDSLRVIFHPWYRGTNLSKEWEPSNWAPCPLEEILCEKLSQFGENPEEDTSRFAKYNFAYEADIFELEDVCQSGKEGVFIAKMPTENEAIKIGHELADLAKGFNGDIIDFISMNEDIAEADATYKWLPADIQLADWLHGITELDELIDTLWGIAESRELGEVARVAWYLCKRYHDIANWQKGFEGKIYLAFKEGLNGDEEGPILLKANDFVTHTKVTMRVAALAATEKCDRKIIFTFNED